MQITIDTVKLCIHGHQVHAAML